MRINVRAEGSENAKATAISLLSCALMQWSPLLPFRLYGDRKPSNGDPNSPATLIYIRQRKQLPFPAFWERHSPLFKKPSACAYTHIGHEENYIWDVSKRLKHSFGLPWALKIIYLQRVKNSPIQCRRNAHSKPFSILWGRLIRANINNVNGANWEGRCPHRPRANRKI